MVDFRWFVIANNMMPQKTELLDTYIHLLQEKSARDIVSLDVSKLSVIADYFIICCGTSERHLLGMAREVQKYYKESHKKNPRGSGSDTGWVLADCGDVIIHLFREETRKKYDLEDLWKKAPKVFH